MLKNNQKIPEGWSVKRLGDLGIFSKGSGITKNDLVSDGLPCIRYAELYTKYNFVIPNCVSFISEEVSKTAKPIQCGDILFAGSGETKEEIGKCAVYDNPITAYAGGDNIILHPSGVNSVFLSYFLNTAGRRYLNRLGQGDSIVHIHAEHLKKIYVPIPPLPEQEKIAEILGTWDEAIEKLSNLIEQKKLLKKGLMQKLLTGKTRLYKPSPLAGEGDTLVSGEGATFLTYCRNEGLNKTTSHRQYVPYIKEFSRQMRKNPTIAENKLWQKIRNNQTGYKFRRQHQIDNKYIADFVCLEKRLIIELDGGQHADSIKDIERTTYLEKCDFRVIRFWDNEILNNIDGCLEKILEELKYTPHPNPLPQGAREVAPSPSVPLPQGARESKEKFTQPWKEVKLGEIAEFVKGKQLNKLDMVETGIHPVLNGGITYSGYTDDWNTEKDTITVSEGGNSCGYINYIKEKFWCGGHCYVVNNIKGNKLFLYHLLKFNEQDIMKLRVGSGLPNIQVSSLNKFKIYIPSDTSEQQAIADVLSTADDEINLLNQKLEALKEQKKGLIQQLLTGQIRVKVN